MSNVRIGIDLGGTKIEGVTMQPNGDISQKMRLATPKDDYDGILGAIKKIVDELEGDTPMNVGLSTPGSLSTRTGLMRNSNSVCLNGMPVREDLERLLQRPLRFANDANCLALSEATDGAAADANIVFAVIIGTGCGGGIAINKRVHQGLNYIGGEWGHMPMPWRTDEELPGPPCFCGNHGCNEVFISGTGLENDYQRAGNPPHTSIEIEKLAADGDEGAQAAIRRYEDRLARSLAVIINFLDPDVIVLGGGMSNLRRLYDNLPTLIHPWIFGGDFSTPIRQAIHGDSSGVRGAAWLWQPEEPFQTLK